MKYRGLKASVAAWEAEVERVAEQLIEDGVPPYEALAHARTIVSRRREDRAVSHPSEEASDE